MWDRLRTHKEHVPGPYGDRLKQKSQQDWEGTRSSSPFGYSVNIKGGPAPPRPPREFEYSTSSVGNSQTSAPAVQALRPPQAGHDSYRNSAYGDRPVSSVYSQPSPAAATFAAQQLRKDVYGDSNEISPPSSPDLPTSRNEPHSYDGGDVSPIEEPENHLFIMNEPRPNLPADQGYSNIPTMRRERRKNSAGAFQATRDQDRSKPPRPHGSDVRWDPRTGEPTATEKGRPSQVNPHQFVQGLSNARAPTGAPRATGQQPISPFGVRLKSAARNTGTHPQTEPAAKPEWRGASGRTALVEPVADNKTAAPLSIPRRSSKRAARSSGVLSPVSSTGSETVSPPPAQAASPTSGDARTALPSQRLLRTDTGADTPLSYPSPSISDDHSVLAITPQQSRPQQQVPTPSTLSEPTKTLFPPNEKAIRRKPAGGAGHNPQVSTSSSVYSQQPAPPSPGQVTAPSVDNWAQPASRFSVTTYATSYTGSPRPSVDDAPPLPTPPRQSAESPKPVLGNSVLDRKRPVVSGYEGSIRSQASLEPIKINMDSSYYTNTLPKTRPAGLSPIPHGNHSTLSVVSVSSVDKLLPLPPPEQSAKDRVTMLNAQIESLGNRRMNIDQAIKQMTQLMPTDHILASEAVIRKRESEKRKVEALKTELAEVRREEYELGLKLHRAYKRMDRNAEYEPTTLWVRRVTG